MNPINQDYVKCKYCKERIEFNFMYAHKFECNQSNHPNYKSEINSKVNEIQSQVQQSRIPNQQTNFQQNSLRQPDQYVESIINIPQQPTQFQNHQNGQHSNNPQYNNSQEIYQQNNNIYSESLLQKAQKKCEYCDELYPIEIMEQHYIKCELKIQIESLSLADYQEEDNNYQNQQQQNPYLHQNDDIDDQINQPQDSNIVTNISEELLSDGRIKKTTTVTNLITQQTTYTIEIVPRQQQQQFSSQLQDQNPRNYLNNFFNSFFRTDSISNLSSGRRNIFMPISNHQFSHQLPPELENLAIIKYVPYESLSQEYKQCSICLINYEGGEELILLPCIHRFHKNCISEWFKQSSTCPICKTDVTEQEMAFEEDDDQL